MTNGLVGNWLSNPKPAWHHPLLAHFVAGADGESYCGMIRAEVLVEVADLPPDRPCYWCLVLLIRDGVLHLREPLPGKGVWGRRRRAS